MKTTRVGNSSALVSPLATSPVSAASPTIMLNTITQQTRNSRYISIDPPQDEVVHTGRQHTTSTRMTSP